MTDTPEPGTKVVPVATESVAPLNIAIIGGTGSGTIITPGSAPNIKWQSVTPLIALAIRFGYTLGTTLVGLLAASYPQGSILHGADLKAMVLIALSAACVDGVKNIVTILGKLESKFPLSTGSV